MRFSSQCLVAVAVLALTVTEAFANDAWGGWIGWVGWWGTYGGTGGGGGGGGAHGVPGPIAGAGLAYLALAGSGYYLFRRWRRNSSGD